MVRSTGLEPVPVAGHAPQTCAYADSATTANKHRNNIEIIKPGIRFVKKKGKTCSEKKKEVI